ncbi:MAG: ABC transporter permease [Chloroflexi bacterium]|nr:ABC transporter permease [Chloroflexota bacterium]
MRLVENLRMALRSLMSRKMRSVLTMLGIIIGTGAVIGLVSVGSGVTASITSQVEGMGANLIIIQAGNYNASSQQSNFRPQDTLTLKDAEAIADETQINNVAGVAPQMSTMGQLSFQGTVVNLQVTGSSEDYDIVNNRVVEFGTFFSQVDVDAYARVVVLGSATAETLFGDAESAVGQQVRINKLNFTVVGVFESLGGTGLSGTRDNTAVIPITTAIRRFRNERAGSSASTRVDTIYVSAADKENIDTTVAEITDLLRTRHKIEIGADDDFTISTQEDMLSSLTQITQIMTIFLGAIAGISLLVGGIGIMNIMLVSVTERTREIGIRKAVGAKRSDILLQFLVESVVLSVIGGAIGIGFGWIISLVINQVAAGMFSSVITASSILMAVGFSFGVGLFFGIYPANRAAALNPIDALRYE